MDPDSGPIELVKLIVACPEGCDQLLGRIGNMVCI